MGDSSRRKEAGTPEALKPKGTKYRGLRGSRYIKWLVQGDRKTFHGGAAK